MPGGTNCFIMAKPRGTYWGVVGFGKASGRVGRACVVHVKAIAKPAVSHDIAVGAVDPVRAVIDALGAPNVLNFDIQQDAFVAHQLERPPSRGEVFQRLG